MAPMSKRGMTGNPYRRKGGTNSPTRNPMVIGGGVIVLIIVLISLFSGSGDNDVQIGDESNNNGGQKLRNSNSAEKEQKESIDKKPESPGIPEELNLQQEIVHDEKKEGVHVEAMEDYQFENVKYFHHYTKGKSGAVIEDMLMAHAYAFHKNGLYGGCCRKKDTVNVERHEDLLDALGLKGALPFACPKDFHDQKASQRRNIILKILESGHLPTLPI
jgi:hypothetical protein